MVGITCICKWFGYFLVQGYDRIHVWTYGGGGHNWMCNDVCSVTVMPLKYIRIWNGNSMIFQKIKADRSCNQSIHQGSSQQVVLSRCFQTEEDYMYIYRFWMVLGSKIFWHFSPPPTFRANEWKMIHFKDKKMSPGSFNQQLDSFLIFLWLLWKIVPFGGKKLSSFHSFLCRWFVCI